MVSNPSFFRISSVSKVSDHLLRPSGDLVHACAIISASCRSVYFLGCPDLAFSLRALCIYFTAIKNIFRTNDLQVAQERLERLLDDYWNIPRGLRGFITGKILPDFERLTLFMRDGLVSKTTNPVENYYRHTDPESTKKIYRTSRGVLSYLAQKMAYWTLKFGRRPQPSTC